MSPFLLTLSFMAGILTFFSPCAIAMLPAYAGYFISSEDDLGNVYDRAIMGLIWGVIFALGFSTVFAFIALLILTGVNVLVKALPFISILLGIILVFIAIYRFIGKNIPIFNTLKIQTFIGNNVKTKNKGIYFWGVMYSLASLGCSFPVFLSIILVSFSKASYVTGIFDILVYFVGISIISIVVSIILTISRDTIRKHLIPFLKYVNWFGNIVILLSGIYLIVFYLSSYFNVKII